MKKYLRYVCSVCKRVTDQLVDRKHAAPDKCTITLRCEGRLQPFEYRSNGGITSAPEVGVLDWSPRVTTGSKAVATTVTDSAPTLINTATGTYKQLVVAVQPSAFLGFSLLAAQSDDLVLVLAERSDAPKSYRQYIYRIEGSFASVNGVEAGLEKKALRYSTTDVVEVYLNGVKLEQNNLPDGFSLYDGTDTSAVPPNTINFNSTIALSGVTQVDVIISAATTTTTVSLTLHRNIDDESRLGTGAWENVNSVIRLGDTAEETLNLYTVDLADVSSLKLNSILTVQRASIGANGPAIDLSAVYILLATKPYSQLDRYTSIAIPLSTLSFDRDYLKYFVDNGETVLYASETAVSSIYPPFKVVKFNTEKTIQTALAGVSDQITIDGSVIVGPDA